MIVVYVSLYNNICYKIYDKNLNISLYHRHSVFNSRFLLKFPNYNNSDSLKQPTLIFIIDNVLAWNTK